MEDFLNEAYLSSLALPSRTDLTIIDILEASPKSLSEISDSLNQEQKIILYNLDPLEKTFIVWEESTEREK
jgi:predicted transcriptional regulator